MSIRGNISGVEGTRITCYCQQSTAQTEEIVSTCMSDGSWSPDPRDLECLPNNNNIFVTTSTRSGLNPTPPLTSKFILYIILQGITMHTLAIR